MSRNVQGYPGDRSEWGGNLRIVRCFCVSWMILAAWGFAPRLAAAQEPLLPAEVGWASVSDEESSSPFVEEKTAPAPEPRPQGPPPKIPELPETRVVGRPGPFPATPLGEGTVLTPTRTEMFASQSGSSLTVVTEAEIQQSRQSDLAEVLRGVPGLDVVQQGGPGHLTSVFLRGDPSSHTKVLIDGIPVNDPGSASRAFDFSLLSVDNIERIEVVRGPQSLLYGSDAIGGVINIITKRGDGPMTAGAELSGGSYGTSREALSVSGSTSRYHYSFGASYRQSDGFTAAARRLGNVEKDGLRQATFSGRFGWTPADDFDVDYVFRYIDQDSEIDDVDFFSGPIDNPIRQMRTEAFYNRVQARMMLLDGFWEQRAGFYLSDYVRRDTDPGFFDPRFVGQARTFAYQSNFLFSEDHTLSAGVDYLGEDGGILSLSERSQHLTGIYVMDALRLWDRWFLTAGARWDEHSSAGSASTYRVTGRYRLRETGTSPHGSIGTGFRAPALEERFNNWVGNANLRPETTFGWDCGLEQSLFGGRLVVDGTYFRKDDTDLIAFFPTGPFSGELRNIGSALSSGVETTAGWQVDPCTSVRANYVYNLTRDQDSGLELDRRPRHKAALRLSRRLCGERARVDLVFLYVGPRKDALYRLGEYYLVNLAGSYDLTSRCQLFARIDNLLDEDYEEVFGYQTAGISGYGGVNFRW